MGRKNGSSGKRVLRYDAAHCRQLSDLRSGSTKGADATAKAEGARGNQVLDSPSPFHQSQLRRGTHFPDEPLFLLFRPPKTREKSCVPSLSSEDLLIWLVDKGDWFCYGASCEVPYVRSNENREFRHDDYNTLFGRLSLARTNSG